MILLLLIIYLISFGVLFFLFLLILIKQKEKLTKLLICSITPVVNTFFALLFANLIPVVIYKEIITQKYKKNPRYAITHIKFDNNNNKFKTIRKNI